jgi:HEAT repeat protein
MNTPVVRRLLVSALGLGLVAVSSSSLADGAADANRSTHAGRAAVYRNLQTSSLETVSSTEVIRSMFDRDGRPIVAPTRIWKVLEHGEKVECLSCISLVSGLLYDAQPKTREIAAWWLRRRIFGVFGPGEVYSRVIDTLGDETKSEQMRARAADAVGEFLSAAGAKHLSRAIREDQSVVVREAAVKALMRMNHQGTDSALSVAMGDEAEPVRLAAVRAATRVHSFRDLAALSERIGDSSAGVRREAAAALGIMRARDAVDGLIALASPEHESDPAVRMSAIWSLGQLGDPSAADVVQAALSDPDRFVRDAARAAGRRLY